MSQPSQDADKSTNPSPSPASSSLPVYHSLSELPKVLDPTTGKMVPLGAAPAIKPDPNANPAPLSSGVVLPPGWLTAESGMVSVIQNAGSGRAKSLTPQEIEEDYQRNKEEWARKVRELNP